MKLSIFTNRKSTSLVFSTVLLAVILGSLTAYAMWSMSGVPARGSQAASESSARALPPVQNSPLAYGFIQANGTILSGSGNFTARLGTKGTYTIKIQGQNGNYFDYSTVVTPANSLSICAPDPAAEVTISCFAPSGGRQDTNFSFIVF